MQTTLKKATNLLIPNDEKHSTLLYYVKQALIRTGNQSAILKEGEIVEVQYKDVTISFMWDNISAVNNTTNEYTDIMNCENAAKVFLKGEY